MTEDKPVAWEVEFGNGEVELWSVKDHSSEPAFGETVTALYSKSPSAVRAAAIAECARVCEMHASSTWNDDRRAQARLDANEIRALSHRPTVSEAEIAKVVYGSTLYHTQLEAVSAVLQSLGYEVKP